MLLSVPQSNYNYTKYSPSQIKRNNVAQFPQITTPTLVNVLQSKHSLNLNECNVLANGTRRFNPTHYVNLHKHNKPRIVACYSLYNTRIVFSIHFV